MRLIAVDIKVIKERGKSFDEVREIIVINFVRIQVMQLLIN